MKLKDQLANVRHVHLAGIGGVGVSALAPVLINQGYTVSGSDPAVNAITDRLKAMGIKIFHQHHPENIEGASLLVVSSAIAETNPEVEAAKSQGIPIWPRARMLGHLMKDCRSIAVTGTHGKTTVTAMIAQMLVDCGLNPTAFIGGEYPAFGGNIRLGDGTWVVAEGDESDGSFVYLYPEIAVVNNIDADHLDYYQDMDEITERFETFLGNVDNNGWIVLSADCEHTRKLANSIKSRRLTYGFHGSADIRALDYVHNEKGCEFEVRAHDRSPGRIQLPVSGRIYAHNALSAVCIAQILGLSFNQVSESLRNFKGVKRRMELKGVVHGVTCLDDYAHHPNEIQATVSALKERFQGRLIGVFQPHLFSRTLKLKEEFGASFIGLNLLILTDIYPARERPMAGVSGEILLKPVRINHVPVVYIPELEEIPKFLKDIVGPGDVVITLGAGDIWKVGERFLSILDNEKREAHDV